MHKKSPSALLGLFLSFCLTFSVFANSNIPENPTTESPSNGSAPVVSASAAVLMDAKSGVIIYSKDMDTNYYPASITKILTALLAIEKSNNNYDQRVNFSYNAVHSVPYGDSHIAMQADESLSLEECLIGLMLASANEVANALGEHFAETTDAFAEIMNERAVELGAVNTHFVNPHGSHDENHYTTALDMAYIMKEAVTQPKFIELISTKSYKLPPTEKQPQERALNNSNRMIQSGHDHYYEYVIGGKTGFTDQAGNTLVTYAKKDNMELIAVILNNVSSVASYTDTRALFEYGFNMFGDMKIFTAEGFSEKINIVESTDDKILDLGLIDVYAKDDITMYLPSNLSASDIKRELDMPYQMEPPVLKDQKVGTLKFTYMENELASVDLFASTDSPISVAAAAETAESLTLKASDDGLNIFIKIALTIFTLLFATTIIYIITERRRRKRKREHAKARREKLSQRRPSKETNPNHYKYKRNNIHRHL